MTPPSLPALCAVAHHPSLQRRLILGAVAAVGLGAFALVPTQQLQLSKPSKPLFFYLVPLLRCAGRAGAAGCGSCMRNAGTVLLCCKCCNGVAAMAPVPAYIPKIPCPPAHAVPPLRRAQALLAEAEAAVPDGDLRALKALLARILGEPNNLQANLRDAAACERGRRPRVLSARKATV